MEHPLLGATYFLVCCAVVASLVVALVPLLVAWALGARRARRWVAAGRAMGLEHAAEGRLVAHREGRTVTLVRSRRVRWISELLSPGEPWPLTRPVILAHAPLSAPLTVELDIRPRSRWGISRRPGDDRRASYRELRHVQAIPTRRVGVPELDARHVFRGEGDIVERLFSDPALRARLAAASHPVFVSHEGVLVERRGRDFDPATLGRMLDDADALVPQPGSSIRIRRVTEMAGARRASRPHAHRSQGSCGRGPAA